MRLFLIAIPLVFVQTAAADPFSFSYTGGPVAIPDFPPGTPAIATINVGPGSGFTTINDIDVLVDIAHPAIGNLDVFLDHVESATSLQLFDNYGGFGANLSSVTFDDEALTLISDGSPAYGPGSFMPASGQLPPTATFLSVFDGTLLDGTWNLRVVDSNALGGAGTILGFAISGDANISTVPEPSSFAVLALGGFGYWGVRRRRRPITSASA